MTNRLIPLRDFILLVLISAIAGIVVYFVVMYFN